MPKTKAQACNGKDAFERRVDAEGRMYKLVKQNGNKLSAMRVYNCKYCNKFHVGHKVRYRRILKGRGRK